MPDSRDKTHLVRHSREDVTESVNRACLEIDNSEDPFLISAGRLILERSQWLLTDI